MNIVTIIKDRYTVDSLYQWDFNQSLEIRGLSLLSAPAIHFTNTDITQAIVRQSTMDDAGVITVSIPNSLLKKPYKLTAYVCVYEGDKFNSLYAIEIPVRARPKPIDYIEVSEEEIYSTKVLIEKLDALNQKVDDIFSETEKEFNSVDKSLEALDQKIDDTVTSVNESFASVNQSFETVNDTLDTIENNATETITRIDELGEKVDTIEEEIASFETVAIDLSNFETNGQIVETDSQGATKTTTVEFDESGNPTKITDGDGNEIAVTW